MKISGSDQDDVFQEHRLPSKIVELTILEQQSSIISSMSPFFSHISDFLILHNGQVGFKRGYKNFVGKVHPPYEATGIERLHTITTFLKEASSWGLWLARPYSYAHGLGVLLIFVSCSSLFDHNLFYLSAELSFVLSHCIRYPFAGEIRYAGVYRIRCRFQCF